MGEPSFKEIPLPIRYEEGSAAYFYFAVSADKIRRMIDRRFRPATFLPGTAMVAVCFYEYTKTSIGPYNELGIGVMVQGPGRTAWPGLDLLRKVDNRGSGFYVLHLPVTSKAAEEAGKRIWGLPKFVTKIPFQLKGRSFEGSVLAPRSTEALFTVKTNFTPGIETKGMDMALLNDHGKEIEKTVVNVQARFRTAFCRRFELTIGAVSDPVCDTLQHLNLDEAQPIAAQYTTHFISQLHGPNKAV